MLLPQRFQGRVPSGQWRAPGSVSFCRSAPAVHQGTGPLVLRDLSFDVEGGSMVSPAAPSAAAHCTVGRHKQYCTVVFCLYCVTCA